MAEQEPTSFDELDAAEELRLEMPEGWGDDEELDPELIALGEAHDNNILRPLLMIGVLILGGYIISDWGEELSYFFSSSEPVEIGSVTDFPARAEKDSSWSPDIPHNRYVRLDGIPSKRAISKSYRYFKLVGGEVYIEQKRSAKDRKEHARGQAARGIKDQKADRMYFSGTGRALAFSAAPERYSGLRDYYRRVYNVDFCVDLTPLQRRQIERKRREIIVQTWKARHDEATPSQREKQKLTSEPSEEQINALLRSEPACVDAVVIQTGVSPRDHWWYLALTCLFLAFMVTDLVLLIRWIRRALKPRA